MIRLFFISILISNISLAQRPNLSYSKPISTHIKLKLINNKVADSLRGRNLSILLLLNVTNHFNGGTYYSILGKTYVKTLKEPKVAFSIGVRYKKMFQFLDYASRYGNPYDLSSGGGKLSINYFGYQILHSFLEKLNPYLRPITGLNLSFVHRVFSESKSSVWPGGGPIATTHSKLVDNSNSFFMQIPIGFFMERKRFFVSFTYNIPVYGWVKGTYTKESSSVLWPAPIQEFYEKVSYNGHPLKGAYLQQVNVFCMKLGVRFNFKTRQ